MDGSAYVTWIHEDVCPRDLACLPLSALQQHQMATRNLFLLLFDVDCKVNTADLFALYYNFLRLLPPSQPELSEADSSKIWEQLSQIEDNFFFAA